jgi:hypothetical protein
MKAKEMLARLAKEAGAVERSHDDGNESWFEYHFIVKDLERFAASLSKELRALIANDGYAASFQSMGQYRKALLAALDTVSKE